MNGQYRIEEYVRYYKLCYKRSNYKLSCQFKLYIRGIGYGYQFSVIFLSQNLNR